MFCDLDSDSEPISAHSSKIPRLNSSSSYTLDLNVEASTVYLSRPPPSAYSASSPESDNDFEKHKATCKEAPVIRTSEQRELVPEFGWHEATLLREENGEKLAYTILTEAFKQHEQGLLKQLLSINGLSVSWSDVIIPLLHEIVNGVRPGKWCFLKLISLFIVFWYQNNMLCYKLHEEYKQPWGMS